MIWGAVIVAAGRGTRLGRPKQLIELAGKPMLAWSIETFAAMPEISEIAVVTEPDFIAPIEALAAARVHHAAVRVVAGGDDRQASVRHGLDALSGAVAGILVHDGARPLVRAADVRAGMRPVRPGTGSLLAARVVDTIKVADGAGKVTRTLDRAELWSAQTPQFATARDLRRAHAEAHRHGTAATDDAALLERAGLDVVIVESAPENFKVTLASDLGRAEMLLANGLGRTPTKKRFWSSNVTSSRAPSTRCWSNSRRARRESTKSIAICRMRPSSGPLRPGPGCAASVPAARPGRRRSAVHRPSLAPGARERRNRSTARADARAAPSRRARIRRPPPDRRPPVRDRRRSESRTRPGRSATATPTCSRTRSPTRCLGACALGDLGAHFPDTDPQWKDADSLRLLAACHELAVRHGWTIANIDATVVVQAPKLAPYLGAMRDALADTLGLEVQRISVKAKTSEGLGYTGDGSGIAAYAVVLVEVLGNSEG